MSVPIYAPYLSSDQLQSIVDSINNDEMILCYKDGVCYLEHNSNFNYYMCPSFMCQHNKMNVWKIIEKIKQEGFQGSVCVNGCRNNCIRKDADLSITATIGGICIRNCKLPQSDIDAIIAAFDEERIRWYRYG